MTLEAAVDVARGSFTLDVECSVADGEMLAVLGPNGAGKTTLLRALAGLLPVERGRIVIDGAVVDDPERDTFVPAERRSVGVVFQDYLLFDHLSALDNVAFGLREKGMRRRDARERARGQLADIGPNVDPDTRPRDLSGGEAQRVALARALATEPALLLLDEPLAALDVRTRVETRRELRTALSRFAGARVLVTHDPIDALVLADRLLVIEHGRVVQEGTPDAVFGSPRSPYVAELAGVNLYRGRAEGALIRVGDDVIVAADAYDGDVLVTISPHAVVLHRAAPEGSARNVWSGTVAALERSSGRVRVRIGGTLPIVAEVTPAAVGALGLAEGTAVWAAVKATEVEVQPA